MDNIKDISLWTRKEFQALSFRESWSEPVDCDCLIILPTRKMHDSGYRAMDFVAIKDGIPICRCSGCSDVINFDGIGGYGQWKPPHLPKTIEPTGWSMDCLKRSGLLRIFCRGTIKVDSALSSMEIFAIPKDDK